MSFIGGVGRSQVGSGIVIGPGYPKVRIAGVPVSVVGDKCNCIHNGTMLEGSMKVRAGGRPVCRVGHRASCGDTMLSGYAKVRVNS